MKRMATGRALVAVLGSPALSDTIHGRRLRSGLAAGHPGIMSLPFVLSAQRFGSINRWIRVAAGGP